MATERSGRVTFEQGAEVMFREPLSPAVWTRGVVLSVMAHGQVRIRPEGCTISRVICEPCDVVLRETFTVGQRVQCAPKDQRGEVNVAVVLAMLVPALLVLVPILLGLCGLTHCAPTAGVSCAALIPPVHWRKMADLVSRGRAWRVKDGRELSPGQVVFGHHTTSGSADSADWSEYVAMRVVRAYRHRVRLECVGLMGSRLPALREARPTHAVDSWILDEDEVMILGEPSGFDGDYAELSRWCSATADAGVTPCYPAVEIGYSEPLFSTQLPADLSPEHGLDREFLMRTYAIDHAPSDFDWLSRDDAYGYVSDLDWWMGSASRDYPAYSVERGHRDYPACHAPSYAQGERVFALKSRLMVMGL